MAALSAICHRKDRLLVIRSLDQQCEKILKFAKTYVKMSVIINLKIHKYLVKVITSDKQHFKIGMDVCQ